MNYTQQQISEMNTTLEKAYRILKDLGHVFKLEAFVLDGHLLRKLAVDQDTDVAVTLDHGLEIYHSPSEYTDGHLNLEMVVMRVLEYLNRDYLVYNPFKKKED